MDRMQIYVETEQRLRLNALARAQGRPAAELIREALDRYLEDEARQISESDGLFQLIGAGGPYETATDVSENHHRYLAMADPAHPTYEATKRRAPAQAKKRRTVPRRKRSG
jgi:predicted transcriptional regulator